MPETLKRITPEEVLKALTKNNLIPYQEDFTVVDRGKNCACGLSAVVIGNGKEFGFVNSFENPETFVLNTLIEDGFKREYLVGFVYGFDYRETRFATTDEIHALGIKDGIAAWEEVKHLALPEDDE